MAEEWDSSIISFHCFGYARHKNSSCVFIFLGPHKADPLSAFQDNTLLANGYGPYPETFDPILVINHPTFSL